MSDPTDLQVDIESTPYRIRTERLLLRCYEPEDAEALREATAANKEHLTPFMPWARNEPQTLEEKIALVRRFRGEFDLGKQFVYGVFDPESGRLIGGTGVHLRAGPNAVEIGYWIDKDRVGHGLATEASCALIRTAFEIMKAGRVDIRCEPENVASARVPEKLGFRREGLLRARLNWHDGAFRDALYWSLLASEYPDSPAAKVGFEAFDILGRKVF
jgi:RimJ/RimL family protein N-acetyltransferase